MGVRNPKREELLRLEAKSLEARFRNVVRQGLNCSAFEAEAVLDVVKEVFFPFLDEASPKGPPGKVSLVAVCADEPPGKAVAECEQRAVCLTVHRGPEDDRLRRERGPKAFRRARLVDLCQEALSQGALLTHRVEIVRLALQGKTTSQICGRLRHSPAAVTNYLATFARCACLARQGLERGQIAFVLGRSRALIAQYLELLAESERDKVMAYHVDQMVQVFEAAEKKGLAREGRR